MLALLIALASVVSHHLPIQIPFIPHFSQLQPFSLAAQSVAGEIDLYFPFSSSLDAYYSSRVLVYKSVPTCLAKEGEELLPK